MDVSYKYPLIFILGPTGVGKSSWFYRSVGILEKACGAAVEVLNCDSVQCYKYVNIGSAKPSLEEQKKVVHHQLGVVEIPHEITLGDYYRASQKIISDVLRERAMPLFVLGGSGFYAQALDQGMFEVSPISEEITNQLQDELKSLGLPALYEELVRCDVEYAYKISAHDSYRVLRALAVIRSEGRRMSEVQLEFDQKREAQAPQYRRIKVAFKMNRERLRERVSERVLQMLRLGLENEVKELLEKGARGWAPLKSVGYKEMVSYLDGEISSEKSLVEEIVKNTMRLAKRQMTWLRRDSELHWFEFPQDEEKAVEFVCRQLQTEK